MTDPVRVRFAPSPTGLLHVGGLRSALFNWLLARKYDGTFILRIEDTDQKRYTRGSVRTIMESLLLIGLEWDEGPTRASLQKMQSNEDYDGAPDVGGSYGPYIQSLRLERYKQATEQLIASGHAYRCDCTPQRLEQVRQEQRARKEPPRYDLHCRFKKSGEVAPDQPHVVRFAMPREGRTTMHDLLRGKIEVDNGAQSDFVLLKSDNYPTYHLAAMVDDHDMQISHVMRAEEWLPSFPKHIQIYNAFGWEPPIFVHLPVILNPSGQGKMSKRKKKGANSIFVLEFRDAGYLPEALSNFLAFVGWAPGEGIEQEIFSIDKLIQAFSLEHINPAPAAFSYDKLDWMNGVYIRSLAVDDLAQRIYPFLIEAGLEVDTEVLKQITPDVQERIVTLRDAVELLDFLFIDKVTPDTGQLIGKGMDAASTIDALQKTRAAFVEMPTFDHDAIETTLRGLSNQIGLKPRKFFTPIRVAISGKKVAPPLFSSLQALGRERVLERLDAALALLDAVAS